MSLRSEVIAVVVTFHPSPAALGRLLRAVEPQVAGVVIVDNGSAAQEVARVREASSRKCVLLTLGENLGLAAALNRGIAWAGENSADYVLLLDQDSVPSGGMVQELLNAFRTLKGRGEPVAAVGPVYTDARKPGATPAPFIRFGALKNTRVYCAPGEGREDHIQTDFLISSGTLIPLPVIDVVGAMDESFFIDNVDMEWCFRASARGFRLFGACRAKMLHNLGDNILSIWFMGTRNVIRHPPLRLYYMMRNRLLLYRGPHTPPKWIIYDLFRLVVKFGMFALAVAPRLENTIMMLKGIYHGVRGRAGKMGDW